MTERRWSDSEAEAAETVKDGLAALNAGDDQTLFDTFHVPHVRISGNGAVAIYATREDLEGIIGVNSRPGPGIPGITRS